MANTHGGILYYVITGPKEQLKQSNGTESGWDNPFRPDGDLSREADEIVSLIRGGKPITPTPNSANTPLLPSLDETDTQVANNTGVATPVTQSPVKALNSAPLETKNGGSNGTEPRTVELQRSPEPMQPEHVLIKKKPKCKCCVIQ